MCGEADGDGHLFRECSVHVGTHSGESYFCMSFALWTAVLSPGVRSGMVGCLGRACAEGRVGNLLKTARGSCPLEPMIDWYFDPELLVLASLPNPMVGGQVGFCGAHHVAEATMLDSLTASSGGVNGYFYGDDAPARRHTVFTALVKLRR